MGSGSPQEGCSASDIDQFHAVTKKGRNMKTALALSLPAVIVGAALVLAAWFRAGEGERTVIAQLRAQITLTQLTADEMMNAPEVKG